MRVVHWGVATLVLGSVLSVMLASDATPKIRALQDLDTERSLVILSSQDPASYHATIDTIRSGGGDVTQGFFPTALIADLAPALETSLRNNPNVALVTSSLLEPESVSALGTEAVRAARVYNSVYVGTPEPAAYPPPPFIEYSGEILPDQVADGGLASGGGDYAPGPTEPAEFMAGDILAKVIFVESSQVAGNCTPADENHEDWDEARKQRVRNQISQTTDFWTSRSNRPSPLSITIAEQTVPTSCEPIDRGVGDRARWIADVLTAMGCPASPSNYVAVDLACKHTMRTELGFDWIYFIWIVDSYNDPDGAYSDQFGVGFTDVSRDLYLTYDNGNPNSVPNSETSISGMHLIAAHETGHIFGAADEYCDPPPPAGNGNCGCDRTFTAGYLRVANSSCNIDCWLPGHETDPWCHDASIMAELVDGTDVSESARGAIGWRNPAVEQWSTSTIVDVVRTSAVKLAAYSPDPTDEHQPIYTLLGYNVPFPPGPGYPDTDGISISGVKTARWQVDGGAFAGAQATDGSYGEESEDAYFSPSSPLLDGIHVFGVTSINTFGHGSQLATDTLAISADPGATVAPLLSCANVDASPDNKVAVGDILAIVQAYFHDWPATNYYPLYDLVAPYNPAIAGPPYTGGKIRVDDILNVVNQYFDICPLADTQVAAASKWGIQNVPVMENAAALHAMHYYEASSDVPGQGVHYVNLDNWDGTFDPAAPESLVYQNGRIAAQLYVVDGNAVGWGTLAAGPCSPYPCPGAQHGIDLESAVSGGPNCSPACSWSGPEGWHLHHYLCTAHIGTPAAVAVSGAIVPSVADTQAHCATFSGGEPVCAMPITTTPCNQWGKDIGWMGRLWNWLPNTNKVSDVDGTQNGRFADCFPDTEGWKAYNCPQ